VRFSSRDGCESQLAQATIHARANAIERHCAGSEWSKEMIEKYFQLGVRLKWSSPGDDEGQPKDGAIINNPARTAGPMIYDGMDGQLFNIALPHASALGLTMRTNIPYNWLVYAPGRITKLAIGSNDVLTGFMSGCLIAMWTEGGARYAGHVGTVVGRPDVNQVVNSKFAKSMPADTKGFFPNLAWDEKLEVEPKQLKFKGIVALPRVMALVTTSYDMYSLLVFELRENSVRPSITASAASRRSLRWTTRSCMLN
jgi:hypothetical protein